MLIKISIQISLHLKFYQGEELIKKLNLSVYILTTHFRQTNFGQKSVLLRNPWKLGFENDFFLFKNFFSRILNPEMDVKMNLRIITKNHAADPEIGFHTKSISKPYGRATAMLPSWELRSEILKFLGLNNFWWTFFRLTLLWTV